MSRLNFELWMLIKPCSGKLEQETITAKALPEQPTREAIGVAKMLITPQISIVKTKLVQKATDIILFNSFSSSTLCWTMYLLNPASAKSSQKLITMLIDATTP